jgi:hypothetical protein
MKTLYKAWRIEPNGKVLYCESLPGEKGDYSYTTKAENALGLTRQQADDFCGYQGTIGREAKSLPALTPYVRKPQRLFFIEVTDTFGGEANYSWVTRHIIRASTERGAVNKFSRLSGMEWRGAGCERYDSKTGLTCFFLSEYEADQHGQYSSYGTDERTDKEKAAELAEHAKGA